MKLRFSPPVFAIVYCIAYVIVLAEEAPLFHYYPRTETFSWGWVLLSDQGPVMAWYGLMASAAIIGVVAAVLLPQDRVSRALQNRLWLFPLFAMLACAYLMRHFFFH